MVVTLSGSPRDTTKNFNIKVHSKFSNFGHHDEWDFLLQICTVHSDQWFKEKQIRSLNSYVEMFIHKPMKYIYNA